jgi:nitrite reductase/ring-hydroxylating ferredoxin subunit
MTAHTKFDKVRRDMRGPFYSSGTRYFIAQYNGKDYVLEDSCKHRFGPLSLGYIDAEKGTITCPWHEMKSCVKNLVKMAIPSVRIGEKMEFKARKETPQ